MFRGYPGGLSAQASGVQPSRSGRSACLSSRCRILKSGCSAAWEMALRPWESVVVEASTPPPAPEEGGVAAVVGAVRVEVDRVREEGSDGLGVPAARGEGWGRAAAGMARGRVGVEVVVVAG